MKRTLACTILSLLAASGAFAQQGTGVPPRKVPMLVDTMTIMPYLTGSLNLFSGQAFLANATGSGFGGGLSFDLTKQGQKAGLMFDFAFQDMYGIAQNGNSIRISNDSILGSADAYHYWYYVLFEPFLKLQTSGRQKGYFIIGASMGFAVFAETVSIGEGATQIQKWGDTPYSSRFRFDLRAGVGVELAKIHGHELILEARAGYPLTNELSNLENAGGVAGNWKIVTIQGNLGLRL